MYSFFGGKKEEPPKPKTLLTMTKEELDESHKEIKKELQKSGREIDRQIFSIRKNNHSFEDCLEDSSEEAGDSHQEEGGQEHPENVRQERTPGSFRHGKTDET